MGSSAALAGAAASQVSVTAWPAVSAIGSAVLRCGCEGWGECGQRYVVDA